MGILSNRVVAYSLNDGQINTAVAKYRGGKLRIKSYYPQFILPDPEDITVVNVPWDIIQMIFLELPPTKKEKDRIRAAELEIRRIYNLSEDLIVSCIPSLFGKCLTFFLKRTDFFRYLSSYNIDFIPDVAYPNILAELLIAKKLPGRWIYIVLSEYSSGIVIMNGENILNVRMIDFSLNEVNHLIKEETGFELFEIENSGNEELIGYAKRIVGSIIYDILAIINREVIITINTTELEKLSVEMVDGISMVCRSTVLKEALLSTDSDFKSKLSEAVFSFRPHAELTIADLGLLYRGGLELGKVKSITW
ncbi:hypothetical protein NA23_08270 [Fervidobacterium islandicum]|uniref:Uncharacterized protein n=1 Tax=Fervidobacterium islandicum TaxID=2423 RepID=A0AAI8CN17_FERIS|nr:hypothetical protein [Fervidobacterium islandicum]AMW33231.1 hypothetical protein NA23_08270 [Fervidobacterium islandicum]